MSKLIIFEGMDGSGKSTQLNLAYIDLIAKGYKVKMTREPGGTPLGEAIREILKSDMKFSTSSEAYLFATARNEHNIQIKKWLEEGYIILCDRHFLSSYVYQGTDLAVPVNKTAMDVLDSIGIEYQILCFDVNHENYKQRVLERNESSDRFEDKLMDEDYFNMVRNRYKQLSLEMDNSTLILTNGRTKEQIHEGVKDLINNLIIEEE